MKYFTALLLLISITSYAQDKSGGDSREDTIGKYELYSELGRFGRDVGEQIPSIIKTPFCSSRDALSTPTAIAQIEACNQCSVLAKKIMSRPWQEHGDTSKQGFSQDLRNLSDLGSEAANYYEDAANGKSDAEDKLGNILKDADANLASCAQTANQIIACGKVSTFTVEDLKREAKYLKKGCEDHRKQIAPYLAKLREKTELKDKLNAAVANLNNNQAGTKANRESVCNSLTKTDSAFSICMSLPANHAFDCGIPEVADVYFVISDGVCTRKSSANQAWGNNKQNIFTNGGTDADQTRQGLDVKGGK